MKIVSLKAENVKRLKAVEIVPDGNTVVIAGRNGQGKSSVLDAIWMALAGAAGAKETSRPIRDGEQRAHVTLDLGDLAVTRKWTPSGTTLEVMSPAGARYPSPQSVLDGLIGRLAFDPLAFAQMKPQEQRAALLEVLDLAVDPDELARQRQTAYDERTNVNRDGKAVAARLAGLPETPDDTPDEEVSVAALADELQQAEAASRRRAEILADRAAAIARLDELALAFAAAKESLEALDRDLEAQPEPPDPQPIRDRLARVDTVNANVRAKRERRQLEAEVDELRRQSQALTDRIADVDRQRDEAIAAANMPLEDLSFDETGVLYQGVPFSQASSAEQLRVSTAVAMALNPTIRVIRITDGSLLDTDNLELLGQMAADHDFQVWIERVDDTGAVGITIEDGEILDREEVAA